MSSAATLSQLKVHLEVMLQLPSPHMKLVCKGAERSQRERGEAREGREGTRVLHVTSSLLFLALSLEPPQRSHLLPYCFSTQQSAALCTALFTPHTHSHSTSPSTSPSPPSPSLSTGKTLSGDDKTLSALKLKNKSKVMLLANTEPPKEDPTLVALTEIRSKVRALSVPWLPRRLSAFLRPASPPRRLAASPPRRPAAPSLNRLTASPPHRLAAPHPPSPPPPLHRLCVCSFSGGRGAEGPRGCHGRS